MANPKVRVTLRKSVVERFGVERPAEWDWKYVNYPCSDEELIEQCKDADILYVGPVDPISRNVIEHLDNCKMIHSHGVGFDKIDLEAAREKGIYVCNNRSVNAVPVAELAITHMLNCLRRVPSTDAKIKAGGLDGFKQCFEDYNINGHKELSGRTVGLVGLGAIGKAAVKILKAFNCEILYYDVFRAEEFEIENNVKYCTYDEILEKCDIISYHVPVLDSTINMVRKETIDKMKQDAIIINVARGEIVNDQDLVDALEAGKVYAGIDVISPEPPSADHPMFHINDAGKARLSWTPHIAGTTNEAFTRMVEWTYNDIKKVMAGERPNNIVNKL